MIGLKICNKKDVQFQILVKERLKSKDFHKQKQITDIFTIDKNKIVLSAKVSCNNRKDWRYIVGYQVDGETITSLFIKTPKNIFSYGVSQYDKNSAYTVSFNVSEAMEWVLQYRKILNEIESQLFEKLTTEAIKGEAKYMHGQLKTWKERIKTNFHGQELRYDMHCNATTVLKVEPVYKRNKNYHMQVYLEEYKYIDTESQQCSMLSDTDDDGYCDVQKET